MKYPVYPLILFVFLLTLFSACGERGSSDQIVIQETPTFNTYVRAYTSGMVGNKTKIQIQFADIDKIQTIEPQEMIHFSPKLKGEFIWTDRRLLSFVPEKPMKNGQTYQCQIDINEIPGVEIKESDFKFSFSVKKQALYYNGKGLFNYDNNKPDLKMLKIHYRTADFIDVDLLDEATKVTRGGKTINFKWNQKNEVQQELIIDSIYRQAEADEINITIKGRTINLVKDIKRNISIPARRSFELIDYRVNNGTDQHIVLEFSDPISTEQDLEGLIQIDNKDISKTVVDGSQIKVFLSSRYNGSKELTLSNKLKNIQGDDLKEEGKIKLTFQSILPQVKLLKKGTIIPRSSGLNYPFKAVNLRAVNVRIVQIYEDNVPFFLQNNTLSGKQEIKRAAREVYCGVVPLQTDTKIDYADWNVFSLALESLIDVETGAIYRIYLTMSQEHSLYTCKDVVPTTIQENKINWDAQINRSDKQLWDYMGYDNRTDYSNYKYEDRNNPCKPSYYQNINKHISQNIFSSNMGIIAKSTDDDKMRVFISDLLSLKTRSGVNVEVFNFQNKLIAKGKTNEKGEAIMDLQGIPYLVIAKQGREYGYLRVNEGAAQSMSMFEVSGHKATKAVKAFLYADRGVWRPGDSVYLNLIIQDKNKALPKGHPITFQLYNPKNQLIKTKVIPLSDDVIYNCHFKTQVKSPTGNWLAKVKIGANSYTKTIKVETVKPNRIKMDVNFAGKSDIVSTSELANGNIDAEWLHGLKASNLDADISMLLKSTKTKFEKYPNYVFDDPADKFRNQNKEIYKGKLDKNGNAKFKIKVPQTENAPGMLSAQFTSRVFEKGGEFSIDRQVIQVSPFNSYAGFKFPKVERYNRTLLYSNTNTIALVNVDRDGKSLASKELKVEIYEISWRYWYDYNRGKDLSNYINSSKKKLLISEKISTGVDGKAFYDLPKKYKWGHYFVRVTDQKSGHSSGYSYSMRGYWYDYNRSGNTNEQNEAANMLAFKVEKELYDVNEEVNIDLASNGEGKFFVSVESNGKILKTFWKAAEEKNTRLSFFTESDMIPNVYVYIAYLQKHAQTANDLPIRMYGVQSIRVESKLTKLEPIIKVADELKPEETFEVDVSETEGKEMTYTLAVVDEGLLQLTRFNTPEPWTYFHQKEALAVKTWDLYDDVIGAFAGEMAGLLAVGGDGTEAEIGEVKAERFPPVVKFLGPFKLKNNGTNKHRIEMPNYLGAVRVMVVGATKKAYGSADKSVPVKTPLMVMGSFPRMVGPKEKVSLPVTIFNMDESIKKVKVSLETQGIFSSKIGNTIEVDFDNMGEKVVYFPIEVAEQIGMESVNIVAEGHGFKSRYSFDIDVRPSNPRIYSTVNEIIEVGETKVIPFNSEGISGTNEIAFEVSTGININFVQHLKRLIKYPHGCVEQTTSSVFPQLYLSKHKKLTAEGQANLDKNVNAGIRRLYSMQLSNGGLSYWPNGTYANTWGSNYAGHFMIEAMAQGYVLPADFLPKWIAYQRKLVNARLPETYSHYSYRDNSLNQAYRLYTLALAGAPEVGAMNRLRAEEKLSVATKWRLAMAYLEIGRKAVAEELINNLGVDIETYEHYGSTFGSSLRDQAMILETLIEMEDWTTAFSLGERMAKTFTKRNSWHSTQTTAFILKAFSAFQKETKDQIEFNYIVDNKKANDVVTEKANTQYTIEIDDNENHELSITNNSKTKLYTSIQLSGIPLESSDTNEKSNLEMAITYIDLEGEIIDPNLLSTGTDFIAQVKVTNPGKLGTYDRMALTQIFPSGWEIHNERLDKEKGKSTASKFQYRDIRDDRVYTYFTIAPNKSKTFRTKLTATYPGTFYQPAIVCEDMYDKDIRAKEKGTWVEVKR